MLIFSMNNAMTSHQLNISCVCLNRYHTAFQKIDRNLSYDVLDKLNSATIIEMNQIEDIKIVFDEHEKRIKKSVNLLIITSEVAKSVHDYSINEAKVTLDENIKKSNSNADLMHEIRTKLMIKNYDESMSNAGAKFVNDLKSARSDSDRGERVRSVSALHRKSTKEVRTRHRESIVEENKTYNEVRCNEIVNANALHNVTTKEADAVYAERIKIAWSVFEKESLDADTARYVIVEKTAIALEQCIKVAISVHERCVKKALAVHKQDIASCESISCKKVVHQMIKASSKVFDNSTSRAKEIYDEATVEKQRIMLSLQSLMAENKRNNDIEKKLLYKKYFGEASNGALNVRIGKELV